MAIDSPNKDWVHVETVGEIIARGLDKAKVIDRLGIGIILCRKIGRTPLGFIANRMENNWMKTYRSYQQLSYPAIVKPSDR